MRGQRLSRMEVCSWLLLATAVSLGIGLHGRFVHQRVNWDGLAGVAHAYDVFHAKPRANLAMIGFVQPPLPALLQLPIVLAVPYLATSGVASNLLGALSLGAATALLLGIAAQAGLARPWRWGLMVLWLGHPMVLGPAAAGSPLALLMALLMGSAWAIIRWARTQGLRDLVAASLLLSTALIARYEAIFIIAAAVVYLAWRTRRSGGSWSKLEGVLITFALPIAYVAGIWIIANWVIMDDPWHFFRETFGNPDAPDGEPLSFALVQVGLVAFFPIFALAYYQVHAIGRGRPARGLFIVLVTAGLLGWLLSSGLGLPGRASDAYLGGGPSGDWAGHELAAARRLAQTELPADAVHAVAGWPGFAVVLFSGKVGRVEVLPDAEPGVKVPSLSRGSKLVILAPTGAGEGVMRWRRWQSRLPAGLGLSEQWCQGPWCCYQVVDKPA